MSEQQERFHQFVTINVRLWVLQVGQSVAGEVYLTRDDNSSNRLMPFDLYITVDHEECWDAMYSTGFDVPISDVNSMLQQLGHQEFTCVEAQLSGLALVL